jgi:TubC N-terminal docking domain
LSARALLEELREREVHLEADGLMLRVDVPAEADTDELRANFRRYKRDLIRLLERERLRLEEADRRGLMIRRSREPG